jgi:dihydrofolate reductase
MAISRDGFIADLDDETPWSEDSWQAFREFVTSCDVVLVGRRTYEIMRDGDGFVEGPEYVVATSDESFDADGLQKVDIKTKDDLPKAAQLGIIGGGELNGRLAKMGAIDEMILDIEPIELHDGIRLFGEYDVPLKLQLLDTHQINESTVQRHYKVLQ